jgi:hypothetical protein
MEETKMTRSKQEIWDAYTRVITQNQTTREQNDALYEIAQAEAEEAEG